MANSYLPGNNPNSHRGTYADAYSGIRALPRGSMSYAAAAAPAPNTPGGVIKSVRSAPPPAGSSAPAPATIQSVAPAAAPQNSAAAPTRTGIRRSPLTNDASLEEKIADNALGAHIGADGMPAHWNVPTQIEGRDVSTSGRLKLAPTPIPQAPTATGATTDSIPEPRPAQPPVGSEPAMDLSSPDSAIPPPVAAAPVPVLNVPREPVPVIDINSAPPASQPQYGGLIGAARTLGGAARDIASDVGSDIKSIVRQAPRALNYLAGGARRLAEGDDERAQRSAVAPAAPRVPHNFVNSRGQPVNAGPLINAMADRRAEARRIGFSSRPAATIPAGTQFTHGLQSRNSYTRRVFGD